MCTICRLRSIRTMSSVYNKTKLAKYFWDAIKFIAVTAFSTLFLLFFFHYTNRERRFVAQRIITTSFLPTFLAFFFILFSFFSFASFWIFDKRNLSFCAPSFQNHFHWMFFNCVQLNYAIVDGLCNFTLMFEHRHN